VILSPTLIVTCPDKMSGNGCIGRRSADYSVPGQISMLLSAWFGQNNHAVVNDQIFGHLDLRVLHV
jgi:hypothetical protein